ncbi:MAG: hypothetical protein NT061_07200 [Spirochaetes bacterium]|nr:hypothetical protein [Spirochaetota bacterium]
MIARLGKADGSVQSGRAGKILLAFLFAVFASSCAGRLDTSIRNDLSARMALRLELPEVLAARVRQMSGTSASSPLFDTAKIKGEFAGRSSMFLVDLSSPSPESLTSVIWVPSLPELLKDTSLVPTGMIAVRTIPATAATVSSVSQPSLKELSVHLTRENAAAAYHLFPGIDNKLLDSLSPPALEKDPLSAEEYRMNLETVIIGKKAMPSFDACNFDISITAPKTILSASGGTIQGQVFKAKIALLDFLTLERPISLVLRWAE